MNVLTQFSDEGRWPGLARFIDVPGVYAAGRLDRDSEGLLVLTDEGRLQARVADPKYKVAKEYWAQVEGEVTEGALARLREGVSLKDGVTRRAEIERIPPPDLWERDPPIRVRKSIPDSWLSLVLREGRNRQVRRMTAAVGHPTLRLVRVAIGPWRLGALQPGEWEMSDRRP
ncbi:MAG: pseudouridine synthase [Pseudomonadota bacterium]